MPIKYIEAEASARPELQSNLKKLSKFKTINTDAALAEISTVSKEKAILFQDLAATAQEIIHASEGHAPFQFELRSCPNLDAALDNVCPALAQAKTACAEARNPHLFFLKATQPEVSEKNMNNLPGILKVVAYGLSHQPVPKEMVSAELKNSMEVILAKVAFPSLKQNMATAITEVKKCVGSEILVSELSETATALDQLYARGIEDAKLDAAKIFKIRKKA